MGTFTSFPSNVIMLAKTHPGLSVSHVPALASSSKTLRAKSSLISRARLGMSDEYRLF
jgi:hypothetical protein